MKRSDVLCLLLPILMFILACALHRSPEDILSTDTHTTLPLPSLRVAGTVTPTGYPPVVTQACSAARLTLSELIHLGAFRLPYGDLPDGDQVASQHPCACGCSRPCRPSPGGFCS